MDVPYRLTHTCIQNQNLRILILQEVLKRSLNCATPEERRKDQPWEGFVIGDKMAE